MTPQRELNRFPCRLNCSNSDAVAQFDVVPMTHSDDIFVCWYLMSHESCVFGNWISITRASRFVHLSAILHYETFCFVLVSASNATSVLECSLITNSIEWIFEFIFTLIFIFGLIFVFFIFDSLVGRQRTYIYALHSMTSKTNKLKIND